MLKIHKEHTQPGQVYVNGWYREKPFEFSYYFCNGQFAFGTQPFLDGEYVQAEPLTENEERAVRTSWMTRYFHDCREGETN